MQPFYHHKSESFLERLVVNVVINLAFFVALYAGILIWLPFLYSSDVSWIAELRSAGGSSKESPMFWVILLGPIIIWSQICSFALKRILQWVLARRRRLK